MFKFGMVLVFLVILQACSDEKSSAVAPRQDVLSLFDGAEKADIDYDKRTIILNKWVDSLKLEDLDVLEGKKVYLALDDDPIDPEIDWNSPVKSGSAVAIGESGANLVVLDGSSRIVAVWKIENPSRKSSEAQSSSSKAKSSSSAAVSSSSKEKLSSSAVVSSDSVTSSSSIGVSSSSEESSSSQEEPQLPGADFSLRNKFWATTSDAMATEKTASMIKISSEANLVEDGECITIMTREVAGSLLVDGSWKMAGGYYFTGDYEGMTALDIYEQGYASGTPSTDESDITKDMKFGQPFTARPIAFELTYAYNHVEGNSKDYPQRGLAYVMLVSKEHKVVAIGAILDSASVAMTTRTVTLEYGRDPFGILSGDYPVADDLVLGTGGEDVAEIIVMFASSAYAHIVAGGVLGSSDKYRGGEGSSLTLDQLKLIY
ncbi:PCMD domain-containing protein [uncultured Fibrobacter sp.]|uniref:PCMD domain-containing protein n=1 Tax=uncultured Fibrobacter sp. TaxID=261512 RepID=UPI002603DFEC|nr:PCMD domain-containing protein [uncultured Fibrobacter sp.]